ncbi:MAG: GNAT family N-acetyltransferase [Gammaproteobacteria bacterium]|nr:GNAT family N-acetyltransferase [Gammaproteobacteria bacterium]
MIDFHKLSIEHINNAHDRTAFDCGVASLDNYLKRQAKQDVKRRISRVFVVTNQEFPNTVAGYYTLSSLSLELHQLPTDLAQKLPKHPVPAALLGRLAVSKTAQGHGIGKLLLADAIKRTVTVSKEIAVYAMVVDVIDEQTSYFYQQFGFSRLSDKSRRLFLPLKSFEEI